MARTRVGLCRLHLKEQVLSYGHVKPRFVYKWLGAGTRSVGRPNLRREDGPRRHLLCGECEELLSAWETKTQQEIFEPLHDGRASRFEYGPWFTKFAVSVVFRALIASKEDGALNHFPAEYLQKMEEALEAWRNYLLGRRLDPDPFDVQALILGFIADKETAALSAPGINMYLTLAVGSNVLRTKHGGCFAVVKMGKLLVVGVVQDGRSRWNNTRIDPAGGVIGNAPATIPGWLVAYFNYEAGRALESHARLSPRQKAKIQAEVARHGVTERTVEAFRRDVQFLGLDAVLERTKKR